MLNIQLCLITLQLSAAIFHRVLLVKNHSVLSFLSFLLDASTRYISVEILYFLLIHIITALLWITIFKTSNELIKCDAT